MSMAMLANSSNTRILHRHNIHVPAAAAPAEPSSSLVSEDSTAAPSPIPSTASTQHTHTPCTHSTTQHHMIHIATTSDGEGRHDITQCQGASNTYIAQAVLRQWWWWCGSANSSTATWSSQKTVAANTIHTTSIAPQQATKQRESCDRRAQNVTTTLAAHPTYLGNCGEIHGLQKYRVSLAGATAP